MLITLKNSEIYYEIYGSGQPLLCIHGFGPDHRLMKGCIEPALSQSMDIKRIYLDLPGFGQSKGNAEVRSSDDMLAVVLEFIDKVIGKEEFLLSGQSYGGYLARGIVHKMPDQVAGVQLICPVVTADGKKRIRPEFKVLKIEEAFKCQGEIEGMDDFKAIAVSQSVYHFERFQSEIFPAFSLMDEELAKRVAANYQFSFENEMNNTFDKPSLLIAGRQDQITGYQNLINILEQFPRATLAVLDVAGHDLQIEQADLFSSLLKEWLGRVTA